MSSYYIITVVGAVDVIIPTIDIVLTLLIVIT